SGKPVVALGRGGALETVPRFGGVFFEDATEESLARAVEEVERMQFSTAELQEWAARFSEAEFAKAMGRVITEPRPYSRFGEPGSVALRNAPLPHGRGSVNLRNNPGT